jgi:two-component system, NarL family, nitrate/nitrite response regulator NarL
VCNIEQIFLGNDCKVQTMESGRVIAAQEGCPSRGGGNVMGYQDHIRVAVVDNHPLFRAGLVMTVNDTPEFKVVAQGMCSSDAVHIAQDHLPDIIVLDLNMPVSGIQAAREISELCPSVKIVVLTSEEGAGLATAARNAGAHRCVQKGMSATELLSILRSVHLDAP